MSRFVGQWISRRAYLIAAPAEGPTIMPSVCVTLVAHSTHLGVGGGVGGGLGLGFGLGFGLGLGVGLGSGPVSGPVSGLGLVLRWETHSAVETWPH